MNKTENNFFSDNDVLNKNTKEYYETIDECSKKDIDLLISNGQPKHAKYLMETIFNKAEKKVLIFTGHLNDYIYGNDDDKLVNNVIVFLDKQNTSLQIIIQENIEEDIIKAKKIIAFAIEKNLTNKIQIFVGNDAIRNINAHFAIADDIIYRLEYNHEKTLAEANFNDPATNKELLKIFKVLKNNSKKLEL